MARSPDLQNLRLSPRDLDALNALAEALDCTVSRGRTVGDPSWRVLISRIASGDLGVVSAAGEVLAVPDETFGPAKVLRIPAPVKLSEDGAGFVPSGWRNFP